ncbi:MAG: T9SS type A sorting domain-containing protein [Bacteroidales bacterium]|nr:T9SS type A sorting domain-containing protein [Bacteroidales bacterium]
MKTIIFVSVLIVSSCYFVNGQQLNSASQNSVQPSAQQVDRVKSALVAAKIDPAAYEFSGQVTATVYLNGQNFDSQDFCLYSVVRGQVRGISRGLWFEPGKEWVHNHLTYSNAAKGDTVRFRLFDSKSGSWYEFDEFVVFSTDMLIENAVHPFKLQNASLIKTDALSLEASLDVFPNPASYIATIRYSITADQPVVIQVIDYTGRVIQELDAGRQTMGEHQMEFDTHSLGLGIYFLRLKNSQLASKQMVVVH